MAIDVNMIISAISAIVALSAVWSFAWTIRKTVSNFAIEQQKITATLSTIQRECVENSEAYIKKINESQSAFIDYLKGAKKV